MDNGNSLNIPEKSLNNFFEVVKDISTKNEKEIEEKIEIDEEYSLETVKSINKMFKNISDKGFIFKLEGNTKFEGKFKEVIFDKKSYDKLDVLKNILKNKSEDKEEFIEVEGVLTSVNISRNHFRIETLETDISGLIETDLFKRLKEDKETKFIVPSRIKASIKKKSVNELVEGNTSTKYTLMNFEQLNDLDC